MSIEDLKDELRRRKVPPFAYGFEGELNEVYCVAESADGWHVVYGERGNRNDELISSSESAACDEVLRRILGDDSLRRWMDECGG